MAWEHGPCRVYTKKKGQFPDFSEPIIITPQRGNKQFTVENAVLLLHRCSAMQRFLAFS